MSTDVGEFYKQRGFSRRVGFGEIPSLLIIDFINACTDPASPLGGNYDREIAATQELLGCAREKGVQIFFTTMEYDDGLADAGVLIRKVPPLEGLKKGTSLVEVDARLQPRSGELVLIKKYSSAFFGTSLASTLTAHRTDTLIIAGCTTSGCVRASALDGCQHGFRTIVVREAVGDIAQPPHDANLFDIDAKYGDVLGLQEVMQYLSSR